ncbi:MAG: hypothetical protein H0T42_15715 [Deltaproteobacteria bacterium]|nr:hypothetical protein [Deltaproteobacteria bacterium]
MGRVAVWVGALTLATALPAHADGPITNRDYAIDIYEGVAIGDTRFVAMGGAGAALIIGTAGTLVNPSAPAVRETTDTGRWSWDYHIDYLSGTYSTDYDNNGILVKSSGAQLVTSGLGLRIGNWASAFTVSGQETPIVNPTETDDDDLYASALRLRYVLSKWIPSLDVAVGVGIQNVTFSVDTNDGDTLFSINGTGFVGGFTWVPRMENFRVAGAIESKTLGTEVESTCDPENCMGYILPRNVVSPARVIGGFAYRHAKTQWNQLVPTKFRDEHSLTVTTDVLVTGSSPNAFGIEAFGLQQLQRSGRHSALSVRIGAEVEAVPGRLRLRTGSYWEPERFVDQGGRLHFTFGVELRVFEFWLIGTRRGRLSFTGDVASRYRNVAMSVGFWH